MAFSLEMMILDDIIAMGGRNDRFCRNGEHLLLLFVFSLGCSDHLLALFVFLLLDVELEVGC